PADAAPRRRRAAHPGAARARRRRTAAAPGAAAAHRVGDRSPRRGRYRRDTSPAIDRFAEEATRFEWVFAQAPNTPPSQASILTSLYPGAHGRWDNDHRLPDAAETLAEVLSANGYRSAAFTDGGLMAAGFGMEQGFESYDDAAGGFEAIGPKAMDWIDQHLERKVPEPFFLMLHTYDIHAPYEETPHRFASAFLDDLDARPSRTFRQRPTNEMLDLFAQRGDGPLTLDRADLEFAKALYDGGILHVDHWFARLRGFLEARGLWDQMIVAIISDHGEAFLEHGHIFHDQVHAEVARIPLILGFPDDRGTGRLVDTVVESIDLMPTLLEAVGLEPTADGQGRSLLPLIDGEPGGRRVAFSETPVQGGSTAVTTGEHRWVRLHGTPPRLYRYRDDPLEQLDIASRHADEAERLAALGERWRRSSRRFQFEAETVDLPPELREQLVALGYVDVAPAPTNPAPTAPTPSNLALS
ncbi:MAG: sulfatase, partial [Acidobacteriota bacterium]